MALVSKTASATTTGSTLVLRRVKVVFQVYPGTGGTDAERGISGVSFTVTISTTGASTTGTTAADGGVELHVPAGATATIRIFGTDYPIRVRTSLEALTTNKGAQRRLSLLGYAPGGIDGVMGEKTDRALLNFQADSALNADGAVGPKTRTQLRTKFGE